MAKLAVQLKNKFFGLVGRITSCGRAGAAHKDAGNNKFRTKRASSSIYSTCS
jgi:hypothetical protein